MRYEIKKFQDGQVNATIKQAGDLHLKIRGNSYEDLFKAASVKEAWDANRIENKNRKAILTIYCLIGQRSDRRFNENESFDLKVIADFINNMNFDQVQILHPHSDVSIALIHRAVKLSNFPYVEAAYRALGKPILVSPDAGAYKTTHEIGEKLKADLIPANKVRVEGKPQIRIQGNVQGKECLIVDDMADGGRTFMFLAKELKKQGATNVYLYVTHGLFHFGFDELRPHIDHVYCTNSYRDIENEMVTQYHIVK